MSLISNRIFDTLGGARFCTMTNATEIIHGEQFLMMSLPSNLTKDSANRLRITIDGFNTFTIETFKRSTQAFKSIHKETGVNLAVLRDRVAQITGLAIRQRKVA
jgi:hypothetical protein